MATLPKRLAYYLSIGFLAGALATGCGGQGDGTDQSTGGSTGPDTTDPRVVATSPSDGQVSVPLDAKIVIQFSEPLAMPYQVFVDPYVFVYEAIEGSLVLVQKTSTWEASSNTLVMSPSTFLHADTQYTVYVSDGIMDPSSNHLDTESDESFVIWRFTTGDTVDQESPVWNSNATLRAVADRYDTVTVCWWNDEQPGAVVGCDPTALASAAPAAHDPPTGDSAGLIYTVQYRRQVDAGYTEKKSGVGDNKVTLTGLRASTEYEIRLTVSDQSANKAEVVLETDRVQTLPAGRLYVAAHAYNGVTALSDVAQASGGAPGTVVTPDQTDLLAPSGIAVDPDPNGYVYVAEPAANRIAAYKRRPTVGGQTVELGQYGQGSTVQPGHNVAPDWVIAGTVTPTDVTGLCGPSTLRFEQRANGQKILYAANSMVFSTGVTTCLPRAIVGFDVTARPQSPNKQPVTTIERPWNFMSPVAFTVDEQHNLLYVANRDANTVFDNGGGAIDVYAFTPPLTGASLDAAPRRSFWSGAGGACSAGSPASRICGPTALSYDAVYDRLYVVNREKNNLLVFHDVSLATGAQTPSVVQGANTGLDGARPVGMFIESSTRRVYVTTDISQSVLIFDADALSVGGDVAPLRVIKGTKALLGQPANVSSAQSRGPFAVTVVRNASSIDEAYVATPGAFSIAGLPPLPTITVFEVWPPLNRDPVVLPNDPLSKRTTNTPPARVLVNPGLGASGVALDRDTQRLYVASFHANMILVYNDPLAFVSGRRLPDRIIGGPSTLLDHPVSIEFRRQNPGHLGSLYVVNQSSHSVAVFEEGDGSEATPFLAGNVSPSRYLGPPDGANPFSRTVNLTQMAFPAGLAIDPDDDILYVSNRDAESAQDAQGRRIVAFQNASTIGPYSAVAGIGTENNIAPTWKIEGVRPPVGSTTGTDKTTLKRPAGLLVIPDPDPDDADPDDRLVVANRDGNSVLIFRGVSALVADAAENPTTPPDDIPSLNLAPTWTIKYPTVIAPFGLAFDHTNTDLYVSDVSGWVNIFSLLSLSSSNAAPSITPRVIFGSTTGLVLPFGMALDPQN